MKKPKRMSVKDVNQSLHQLSDAYDLNASVFAGKLSDLEAAVKGLRSDLNLIEKMLNERLLKLEQIPPKSNPNDQGCSQRDLLQFVYEAKHALSIIEERLSK